MDLSANLGFLGLARKAGALAVGSDAVEIVLAKGRAKLVVFASDAGKSTLSKFKTICDDKGVPIRMASTKEDLGGALGRRQVAVAAVTDVNFAARMLKD